MTTLLIGIGASTGGVEALLELLPRFPANCPPTLIVQHMKAHFLPAFAARLDRTCPAEIRLAERDEFLRPGLILIAPGGDRHLELGCPDPLRTRLQPGDKISGHRPSVDALFNSICALGPAATGILLTGMGQDGAAGLAKMRQAGARTIGQDRDSSAVYGMPRAAAERGACQLQLPLNRIAAAVFQRQRYPARG